MARRPLGSRAGRREDCLSGQTQMIDTRMTNTRARSARKQGHASPLPQRRRRRRHPTGRRLELRHGPESPVSQSMKKEVTPQTHLHRQKPFQHPIISTKPPPELPTASAGVHTRSSHLRLDRRRTLGNEQGCPACVAASPLMEGRLGGGAVGEGAMA